MIIAHIGSGPPECLCKKLTKEVYAFSLYSNPNLWTRLKNEVFNYKAIIVF